MGAETAVDQVPQAGEEAAMMAEPGAEPAPIAPEGQM